MRSTAMDGRGGETVRRRVMAIGLSADRGPGPEIGRGLDGFGNVALGLLKKLASRRGFEPLLVP